MRAMDLGKNVMLVETDRYLQLVPFKDLPQMPLKIFRGLDHTGDVRGSTSAPVYGLQAGVEPLPMVCEQLVHTRVGALGRKTVRWE